MAPRIVSLLALVFLGACEPITIRPDRPDDREPAPREELASGSYVVTVEGVAALQCEGVPPRALIGQQIAARLRVGDEEVAFDLGGLVLRGEMIPGALFVEGEEEAVYHDDVDVDVDDDDGYGEEGYREDAPEGRPGGGRDCGETEPVYEGDEDRPDGGGPGEDRPDGDHPAEDCPDEEEPYPPSSTYAAIDARILDGAHAEGRMTILYPGCAVELEVAIAAGELDGTIVYEEEDEPAPGEGRSEDAPGYDL